MILVWYNRSALRTNQALFATLLLVALTGCSAQERTPPLQETRALEPYNTPSPVSDTPLPIPEASGTAAPLPTPTPQIHVVAPNETMIGIAVRYDIALDSLLAANPGIDPRFLSIGQEVVVPARAPDEEGQDLVQLEIAPLDLSEVQCYATPTEAIWCLLAATSDLENPVEGVQVLIRLLAADGSELASQSAFGPLTRLLKGQVWPLAAYFPPPAPQFSQTSAVVLSAIEVEGDLDDLLDLELELQESAPIASGRLWAVSGEIGLSDAAPSAAARVSLLGLAYDADGNLAGYAKWENQGAIDPGGQVPFRLAIFSLGPEIERVSIVLEGLAQ